MLHHGAMVRLVSCVTRLKACHNSTLQTADWCHIYTDGQTDRRTDGRTDRQTDRQTDAETYTERGDTDELGIAGVLITVRNGPLQWQEVAVVNLEVVLSILGNSLFLRQTNTAVLKWSEYCSRYLVVVTLRTHADR